MRVLIVNGSPNPHSRSLALLSYARTWLQAQGVEVHTYGIHQFPAEALLHLQIGHPQIQAFSRAVHDSNGLMVATPVYKAAYSGALKTLLDVLPEGALTGKAVLPLLSTGSSAHLLALEYALKPLLSILKAREILPGVCAQDAQLLGLAETISLHPDLQKRLDDALNAFLDALQRRPPHPHWHDRRELASRSL